MKEYFKSLFPWRWTIVLIFICLTNIIITMGFASENPLDTTFFTNPWLWFGGNFIFWFIIDYFFGLGREGLFFKQLNRKFKNGNNNN